MNALMHFAQEYLLNSLWQAPLIAGVAWLLARALRRLGPLAEHRVWVGALLAQVVLPMCAAPGLAVALRTIFAGKAAGNSSVTFTLGAVMPLAGTAATTLHAGLLLYGAITVVLALRFAWQCVRLQRLALTTVPASLGPEAARVLNECSARLGIATVRVSTASGARTPLTFGILRPLLVLPEGFVAGVSEPELRAAMSHELAHVARRDAAKHVVYRLLSLPVAYHPALWLVTHCLAETRERVCDRIASAVTGDARQYARSLLELASLLTARRPAQSHAIGLFDANQLERRILMLNRRNLPLARSLRIALVAGSGAVALLAGTSMLAMHLNLLAPSPNRASFQVKTAPGVMQGLVVSRVTPVYPPEAKAAKIQGAVVLHAIISKTGTVERLTVISGPTELQASALDAVRQWVYKPYLLNGQPTDVETTITVNFSLAP